MAIACCAVRSICCSMRRVHALQKASHELLIEELVKSAEHTVAVASAEGSVLGKGVVAAAAGVGDIGGGAGDAAVDDGKVTVGCAGSRYDARVR